MEGSQFDALSRRLGATRSRRGALKAHAAAVVTGIAGTRGASAQACTGPYQSCSADSQCCSGTVCEWGMCMPGCRIGGAFAHPNQSPTGNTCQVCNPAVSTTSGAPTNEGNYCWSGNAFGGPTYCQSGVCAPEGPVSCPPLTECHLEGEINPANGLCVSPPAPEGTPCGIGEMCHGGFNSPAAECNGDGHCIAGGSKTVNCAPYKCEGTACASSCARDNDCTNGATCCEGQCLYASDFTSVDHCGACGNACPSESDNPCLGEAICQAGVCGFASRPMGTSCSDDNACDGNEACDGAGTCQPGIPVACDPCTRCNPESGICEADTSQGGVSCPGDGNQCFGAFVCDAGACAGVDPVICTVPDACHRAGACGPGTGTCSPPTPIRDFQTDSNHCGSCGFRCYETGQICIGGTCQCDPSSRYDCDGDCIAFCSNRPDYYRDRFQSWYANFGSCSGAMSHADCYGSLDTETACGTVTGTCSG